MHLQYCDCRCYVFVRREPYAGGSERGLAAPAPPGPTEARGQGLQRDLSWPANQGDRDDVAEGLSPLPRDLYEGPLLGARSIATRSGQLSAVRLSMTDQEERALRLERAPRDRLAQQPRSLNRV